MNPGMFIRLAEGQPPLDLVIRPMVPDDFPDLLSIEQDSFEYPWTEEDFKRSLRQMNVAGLVAEHGRDIAGYHVCRFSNTRVHILSMAVDPKFRRQGVGKEMIESLVNATLLSRRKSITLYVRETNLTAQLFFRNRHFRATLVLRGFYKDTAESAYRMSRVIASTKGK